jgi:hypothetical protein
MLFELPWRRNIIIMESDIIAMGMYVHMAELSGVDSCNVGGS